MAPRAVWRAISLATRLKRRGLANGALIEAAEQAGFALMVTTDENIGYQQNLEGRRLALMVLEHSQWPMVKLVTARIVAAVDAAVPGSYLEVDVPFKD